MAPCRPGAGGLADGEQARRALLRPSRSVRRRRSGSGRRARPGPARRTGRARRRRAPRRSSGSARAEPGAGPARPTSVPSAAIRSRIAAGDLIARCQLVGEAAPRGVEQQRSLAADRLGDQPAVERRARQRQRGGVELAELEVGELGAGACGRGPRRRRSRPRGFVVRCQSAAPPPVARTVAAARTGPRSVMTPCAALAVGTRARAPMRPPAPRSARSAAASSASRLVSARPGLRAAGVDDPAGRVAALEPERQLAVGVEVEARPRAASARSTAAGASAASTSTAAGEQRPRPALSVSSACRAGRVVGARSPPRARPGRGSWRSR